MTAKQRGSSRAPVLDDAYSALRGVWLMGRVEIGAALDSKTPASRGRGGRFAWLRGPATTYTELACSGTVPE
jgi:hypothetical protein